MEVKLKRPELKRDLEKAQEAFKELSGDRGEVLYVFSPERDSQGILEAPLPSYWSEEMSCA